MEVSMREAVTGDVREIRDVHIASIEGLAEQTYTTTKYKRGRTTVTQQSTRLSPSKRILSSLNTAKRSWDLAG